MVQLGAGQAEGAGLVHDQQVAAPAAGGARPIVERLDDDEVGRAVLAFDQLPGIRPWRQACSPDAASQARSRRMSIAVTNWRSARAASAAATTRCSSRLSLWFAIGGWRPAHGTTPHAGCVRPARDDGPVIAVHSVWSADSRLLLWGRTPRCLPGCGRGGAVRAPRRRPGRTRSRAARRPCTRRWRASARRFDLPPTGGFTGGRAAAAGPAARPAPPRRARRLRHGSRRSGSAGRARR